jgi:hypothetical protein
MIGARTMRTKSKTAGEKKNRRVVMVPSATRGAFLKNRPPGPPEKLLIALRAVELASFED